MGFAYLNYVLPFYAGTGRFTVEGGILVTGSYIGI